MAKPYKRSNLDGTGADALASRSVFRHRAFAWFWVARMFSTLATQSESVTIGWQVYTLARHSRSVEQSAFLVGMVGLAQFVPNFLLALIAGATADRRDRRGIILVCTGVEIGCVCGLALLSLHPSPSLVPIFLIAAAFGALLLIRANTRPELQSGSHIEQIREGLAYVWTNKIVLGAISLDLFAVLLGGVTALLPVFASDILKVGAHGFGILRSGPAIGAMATAFALNRWPLHRRAGHWMFAGVAGFGVATLVFALSKSMIVSMFAMIVLGATDMVSVY